VRAICAGRTEDESGAGDEDRRSEGLIASRMSWLGEAAFERGDPRRAAPLSLEVAKSRPSGLRVNRAPRTPPGATRARLDGGPAQTAQARMAAPKVWDSWLIEVARMGVRAPIPELLEFLSAYDDRIVALALAVRRFVLTETPRATETIYDAYNAVAIGYSFTGRLRENFSHIAVYAKHVNLGFNRGADLADPRGILQGDGKQVRHFTIHVVADVKNSYLTRLLREAVQNARELGKSNRIPEIAPQSVVRAIYAKRRRP
jgi:hypothetical protein